MARSTKVVTTTAAVTAVLLPSASIFYGISVSSAEAAAFYVKLWWEGTGVAPPTTVGGTQTAPAAPTPGTTVPHLVIEVPAAGIPYATAQVPLNNGGRIWYWITSSLADNAAAVLVTGGDQVTLIYD